MPLKIITNIIFASLVSSLLCVQYTPQILNMLTQCSAQDFYGFFFESYYTIYVIFRIVLCYFKSMFGKGTN